MTALDMNLGLQCFEGIQSYLGTDAVKTDYLACYHKISRAPMMGYDAALIHSRAQTLRGTAVRILLGKMCDSIGCACSAVFFHQEVE